MVVLFKKSSGKYRPILVRDDGNISLVNNIEDSIVYDTTQSGKVGYTSTCVVRYKK